jgi:energy-coupling factor transporter transmembrane protein EcfT
MLTEFPLIHTNVWDAFWAIPVILFFLLIAKFLMKVPTSWLSTVATVVALFISIFISHPGNLSAGIFMGFFYSGAALGFIYSTEKSIEAFRAK